MPSTIEQGWLQDVLIVQENYSNSVLIECMINILNASAYNIIIVTNYRFCVYSESEQYFVKVEYTKPTACVSTCTTSCKFCSVTYCIIKHTVYSEIFSVVILKDRANSKHFFNDCVNKKEYQYMYLFLTESVYLFLTESGWNQDGAKPFVPVSKRKVI